jgi:hypothetical protein
MVKVSGFPRPRVTWWVNGTMIMTVSSYLIIVSLYIDT